jgi:3-dehydroquinate synthetase
VVEMQKSVKHGFAVASGMELATAFSCEKGYITSEDKVRISNLLRKFKLIKKLDLTDDQIEKHILHDKKKTGTDIHFVFSGGIGNARVEKVSVSDLIDFYKRYRDKK